MTKKLNNQHDFLQKRRDLEQDYWNRVDTLDPISSISAIDITTIDRCNRSCVFCPRHDQSVYPNRNVKMTAENAKIIGERLSDIEYKGTIHISGFGENLLNKEVVDIIREIKSRNPDAFIDCNTNGDPLSLKLMNRLIDAGLDCLNINLYDGEYQVEEFEQMLESVSNEFYTYRMHYDSDHGIIFNNRSGLVQWIDIQDNTVDKVKGSKCYMPFYKMMIDWSGDVLFCSNDWGREHIVGNVYEQSIRDVWMSDKMKDIRIRLSEGDRDFSPCNGCNVKGTMVGENSFNILMQHYEKGL